MARLTIQQAFDLALDHFRAGRLAEAKDLCRQILATEPNHPDALHLLGVIAHQSGHHDIAIDLIRRAIAIAPNVPDSHSNLGLALTARGRIDEAVAAFHTALQLDPKFDDAWNNLGGALRAGNRLEAASEAFAQAIRISPDFAEAHVNLGTVLKLLGRMDDALAAFHAAVAANPDYAEAHVGIGNVYKAQNKLDEARVAFERAVALRPQHAPAHNNLGTTLQAQGKLEPARAAYERAVALKPDFAAAYSNLGTVLEALNDPEAAIAAYRAAVSHDRGLATAHGNLASLFARRGRFDEAFPHARAAAELQPQLASAQLHLGVVLRELRDRRAAADAFRNVLRLKPDQPDAQFYLAACLHELVEFDLAADAFRVAIASNPDLPSPHNGLGNVLKDRGEVDAALDCFRRAIELKPEYTVPHSNLIYTLHFHPDYDMHAIRREQDLWSRRHVDPLNLAIRPHANDRDPNRRLRIGYVSPNFRNQAECNFVLPLLQSHDRGQFEVHCYSTATLEDAITARFRACAHVWHDVRADSDEQLAERIRAEAIDILIDLTMHMAGDRLLVFARKPAPVQVTWLAYPGTTGLAAMDYRLTDNFMDPPDSDQTWSSEKVVRLPDSWCCYDTATPVPAVAPPPALRDGKITFGSLNNLCKVNEPVLRRWARVLDAVPRSTLLLLAPGGQARERLRSIARAVGMSPERIDFAEPSTRGPYLEQYHRIDIALDPFPYNGITTTCDALVMGVPVLTLPGPTPASRAGLGLLTAAGFPRWVASSEDEYVRLASELAGDASRLAEIRSTLRERVIKSPLMDAPRFARHVEAAYRQMWKAWCDGSATGR